jgi:uncharacterized membrane protein
MEGPDHVIVARVVAGVGVVLLLATLPLYLASGLLAPLWAIIGLMLVWVGLLVLAVRWLRRRPFWVIGLPVLAAMVWFAVLTVGEQLLGWTA